MKNWFISYFTFSRREYTALLVFTGLLLAIEFMPVVWAAFFVKETNISPEEIKAMEALFKNTEDNQWKKKAATFNFKSGSPKKIMPAHLSSFDPNELDATGWEKLGLSVRQSRVMMNYQKKGGRFYKAEDLKKMYVISPGLYQTLYPYIAIKKNESERQPAMAYHPKEIPAKEKQALPRIEINGADTVALDLIRGIGATLALRIVKYRDRLGGFYQIEQLKEVYGIDSSRFEGMKPQLLLDPGLLRKIDINNTAVDVLKNHPYLTYKQANALAQYRKQHGAYTGIADLKKVLILDAATIERLMPCLSF